jgi:hypothetical protein
MALLRTPPDELRQTVEAKSRRGRKQNSRTDIPDRHIDRDDHDMLVFAVRWLPYGGGPDDEILITFGMTPERYRQCLRDVVQRQLAHIHPDTAARLLRMCNPDGIHTFSTIVRVNT